MTYATGWIVRFQGTITQGPNAGRDYTFATSWGGVMYTTLEQAHSLLAKYRLLEPELDIRVFRRVYSDDVKGFIETEEASR